MMPGEKPLVSLGKLFAESEGKPVQYQGKTVHRAIGLPVNRDTVLHLVFLSATPSRKMYMMVDGENCKVNAGGDISTRIRVWAETVSSDGEYLLFNRVKTDSSVYLFPGWLTDGGSPNSLVGNCGVVIEEIGEGHCILHCSHGMHQEPNFEDLVVEVRLRKREEFPNLHIEEGPPPPVHSLSKPRKKPST